MLTNAANGGLQRETFSVTIEGITAMDTWVEQIASRLGLSEKAAFSARLCIAELAANVLEHGVVRSRDDHMILAIDRVCDGIEVEFLDTRESFDPTVTQPSAQPRANGGGRGLALVRAYARDLTYVAAADYNRTTFKVTSVEALSAAGIAERQQIAPSSSLLP